MAAALAGLPSTWVVVHDRLLRPGLSEANLDHVAIGPAGVFFIDAKNRAGVVTEYEGGLFQHRARDGVRESVSLAAELKKIHGMAAYMSAEVDGPVVPVLCLAGDRASEFGPPQMVRGVWVVPVSSLAAWLMQRPAILATGSLPHVATRVITEFPSTTTDKDLLAAIGGSKGGPDRPSRRRRRQTTVTGMAPVSSVPVPSVRPRGFVAAARLVVLFAVGAALVLTVTVKLPSLVSDWMGESADGGTAIAGPPTTPSAGVPPATGPGGARRPSASTSKAKKPVTTRTAALPVPVITGPPDCSDATATEVKKIIHRTVKPVATRQGCAWGTRLDDPSTVLVSIVMTEDHSAFDLELTTSVKQKRVVFGGASDATYRPATKASVAAGQWITRDPVPLRARADTVVVVATTKLGISDDEARAMAVAIAAVANY